MARTIVVLCCVLLATVAACAAAAPYDSRAEQELFKLLNQERTKRGIPALQWNTKLQQAGRAHSELLAQHHELSHQFPGELPLRERLAAAGVRSDRDAENVAYDQSAAGANDGFMHSPRHRENRLNPDYNAVGIGIVRQGDTLWVTEDFARVLADYSSNALDKMVAAEIAKERVQAHLPPMVQRQNPELDQLACTMAHNDKLDPPLVLHLPGVRRAVTYTASQPQQLPPSASKEVRSPEAKAFALGSCFARTPTYPGGTNWIVLVIY